MKRLMIGLLFAASLSAGPSVTVAWADKIPVISADQLPRHVYTVTGTATQLLADKPQFDRLLDALVTDVKSDLQRYDIKDRATLEGYYSFLSTAANLKGNFDEAMTYIPILKDLEDDQDDKLTIGMTVTAHAKATRASNGDRAVYEQVFVDELVKQLKTLPIDRLRQKLTTRKQQLGMLSQAAVESAVTSQFDPVLASLNGQVPADFASQFVMTRFALDFAVPNGPLMVDAYTRVLEGTNARTRRDIWTPRLVELDGLGSYSPVVVGIWDTGVDVDQFTGNLWENPSESKNGIDDDNNGFIDDLHGVAFDLQHRPAVGPLVPIDSLKNPVEQLMVDVKAGMDMSAGVESPEAAALVTKVKSLSGESLVQFQEDMGLIGNYSHGTHVAGIAAAGNPFAKLLYVRETFDWKQLPQEAPSIESATLWAESSVKAIDYMKKAGVRVVNMSWRYGRGSVEGQLAAKGVGKTPEERAELSRKIFAIHKDALEKAIKGAPEILFVAGAGNEDNDLDFSEYIPAGIQSPNLITIGAVDEEGKPAVFTSYGKSCKLYANGWMIESVVPGGQRMAFSGTSMAAPQVANLAAKLLAIKPELSTQQLIKYITDGAAPFDKDPARLLINPKKSIDLLGSVK